jgi:hypothetical protein
MSMTGIIDKKIKQGKFYDIEKDWYQFVLDHKIYLRQNSIKRHPSKTYLNKYKHDLQGYLNSVGIPSSCIWIVRIINNIPTDRDFINMNSIYVPQLPIIKDLYKTYKTIYST